MRMGLQIVQPLVKVTIVDGMPIEAGEPDSDEFIYEVEDEDIDDSDEYSLTFLRTILSPRLSIIRCTLA